MLRLIAAGRIYSGQRLAGGGAMRIDTEVFFRPEEIGREASSIRAELFSHCRRVLARSVTGCAFVPVRKVQGVVVRATPLDRILGLASLTVYVAGGSPSSLTNLPVEAARTLVERLARRAAAADFVW